MNYTRNDYRHYVHGALLEPAKEDHGDCLIFLLRVDMLDKRSRNLSRQFSYLFRVPTSSLHFLYCLQLRVRCCSE